MHAVVARLAVFFLLGVLCSCSRYGFEQPRRPCRGVTCSEHGECVLLGDLPACQCDPGYHPEDLECLPDPDPCEGIGCSGHGRCAVTQAGEVVCACDPGFRNDGPRACVPDPVDCLVDPECDDGNRCTVNHCLDGFCQAIPLPAGSDCSDPLFCNGTETCDGSGNCQHPGDPCAPSEQCNELTDACDPVGPGGVLVQLAAGREHVCGLAGDGSLYCWGSDDAGQLGNGASSGDVGRPQAIDLTPLPAGTSFSRVAAGDQFSCALSHAGAVWCWGRDRDGQLGDSPGESPAESPVPVALLGSAPIIQIVTGKNFACALGADGGIQCWGANLDGQCGDGTFQSPKYTPVRVDTAGIPGEKSFVTISAGAAQTCGLTGDGTAYCWGDDLHGQLGDGDPAQDSNRPVPVDTAPLAGQACFRDIAAGTRVGCGITSQGEVYCWGNDDLGTLGDGPGVSSATSPVAVDPTAISGSRSFKQICARSGRVCGLAADGRVYCWGNDNSDQLGDGDGAVNSPVPVPIDTGPVPGEKSFASLACGSDMTCGLTARGAACCWGLDQRGQLGDGPADGTSGSPVAVDTALVSATETFVDIQSGADSSCGLSSRGEIWCWGADQQGQLGDGGTLTDMDIPVPVDTSQVSGDSAFIRMAVGYHHVCALTGQGRAHCWGTPEYGALGDGGGTPDHGRPYPVNTDALINESHFIGIAAGNNHTCGLTADGAAWCWGFNWYGQVGDGTDGIDNWYDLPQAVDVSGNPGAGTFLQLAAGTDHSCGIAADGTAYCWGYDGSGALGNGESLGGSPVPSEVDTSGISGSRTFRQIDAFGYEHTCGITTAGESFCWGWNNHGEVGIGSPQESVPAPAPLDTSGITGSEFMERFNLGHWFSCGLTGEGVAYCWGSDFLGALGNGGLGDTLAPGPVDTLSMAGSTRFRVVAGGGMHACAITTDGLAHCWGANYSGQAGTGDSADLYETPRPVAWP